MLLLFFGHFAKIEIDKPKKMRTVIAMAGKSSCEFCAYYNYNEYYDDYECSVNLDEDDVERFMSGSESSCPYFRFSDDYKIVEKQN